MSVASASLELVDIQSCARGVRDGDLTHIREGRRMLAVVPDVGEQEGAEVDLSLSGQHEQGCALDAASVGNNLHGAAVRLAGSSSRDGVGGIGVMGSGGLRQDRHVRDSMDAGRRYQVFLSQLVANNCNGCP
jgi:hypothetical protein